MSNKKGKRRERATLDVFVTNMLPIENYTGNKPYLVYAGHSDKAAIKEGDMEDEFRQGQYFYEVHKFDGKRFTLIHSSEKEHIDVMKESLL